MTFYETKQKILRNIEKRKTQLIQGGNYYYLKEKVSQMVSNDNLLELYLNCIVFRNFILEQYKETQQRQLSINKHTKTVIPSHIVYRGSLIK